MFSSREERCELEGTGRSWLEAGTQTEHPESPTGSDSRCGGGNAGRRGSGNQWWEENMGVLLKPEQGGSEGGGRAAGLGERARCEFK